ncbi:MAG: 2-dehydropantoate 2-reductase [Polyangiales bacterium]
MPEPSPRLALVGPGAVGGAIAARLLRVGRDVTVCARTPFAELRAEAPDGARAFAPRVVTDPSAVGPVDLILLATKAYDVDAASPWLDALVGANTRVAVLQNGVEHRARVARWVPAERVVPVVVDLPCDRVAPGFVRERGAGSLTVPDDAGGRAFAALFEGSGLSVRCAGDFVTAAWRKLCLNCVGAINALALRPAGVFRDDAVAELAAAMARECVAVGRAEGAALGEADVAGVVARCQRSAPDAVNSLLADRLAGRPMEVDARNGVIVRLGARHGIAAPLNAMAAAILGAATGPAAGG